MWKLLIAVIGLSGTVLHADERPLFLPFEVTLGGQKAVMEKDNALFAVVAQPVKPNAELTIEKEAPMLIINAFACKEDGTVEQNAPAAVISLNILRPRPWTPRWTKNHSNPALT